jgi:hypothetical protein
MIHKIYSNSWRLSTRTGEKELVTTDIPPGACNVVDYFLWLNELNKSAATYDIVYLATDAAIAKLEEYK